MMKIMDGNEAMAYSAYNFTEVSGLYPITPASPMGEVTDKWAGEGKKNFFGTPVKVVEMESEAGAAGMIHGSLLSGALTSTYTASQGLLLMLPDMYKIAGEGLPCVINVSARTIATHALSIFGDHSDIYAAKGTGFAFLASSSVQDAMDLTNVSYLSAIKGKVPFVNFMDGFRTSHEIQKIETIDTEKVKELIDLKALSEFRNRSLNPNNPYTYGTNQNGDVYFQMVEARNKYYDQLPDIVNNYMKKINSITGRNYKPFNYYGAVNATKVIVSMGSVSETIKETVSYLTKKGEAVGVIEVHLFRPFSSKYFLSVLPKTVKKIIVLDRCKEAGDVGETLYLDVLKVVRDVSTKVKVIGGRYGLASKDTTPSMIKALFDFVDSKDSHSNFTIGINDDVTNLSVKYDPKFLIPSFTTNFMIYGYGSDGMVSASKDILKITGNYSKAYVQGYFQYDSKKSGGVTISHLRFSGSPIHSEYYNQSSNFVICTKDSYLNKLHMFEKVSNNGIFLLNTHMNSEELIKTLSNYDKRIIEKKNIKLYIVDASNIAKLYGLDNKISSIMETIIFKLGKLIDYDFAVTKIKESIEAKFGNKGGEIALKNIKAIDNAISNIVQVKLPNIQYIPEMPKNLSKFEIINTMEGDTLPVSSFLGECNGEVSSNTSKLEKRDIAENVPCYDSSKCIQCGLCSLVCPHAVIRPFLLDEDEVMDAPSSLKDKLTDMKVGDVTYKYTIGISVKDCTGCSLCANICPGKKGEKALTLKEKVNDPIIIKETEYLFNEVGEKRVLPNNTVKGTQLRKPKFEFSGACAGCGETPYLKLLSQLFGDNMIVANATGCSSIYSASYPSSPWSTPWANSLFEDNAEFGYGMRIADIAKKNRIATLINDNINLVKKSEEKIYKAYINEPNMENSDKLLEILPKTKIPGLLELKDDIKPKSIWIVGGDGWAYDIGFNGIDHVLANHENVNILVLDTEVYSNTGGQASKSTRLGATAKFVSSGKKTAKKDLARIALTYPHVYVGTISLGANPMQAIKVLNEAEAYDGPSIVIAYSPCIAQKIIKGMGNSIEEEKKATNSGYFPIFHYNPVTKEFKLDSKADFSLYADFLGGEDRYRILKNINKDYKKILEENKRNAEERYNFYQNLSIKKEQ